MKEKKPPLSVAKLATIDLLLLAASLCVFSLFHHVLPRYEQTDLSLGNSSTETHVISTATTTADTDSNCVSAADSTTETEVISQSAGFTDGEIIQTETSYQSENINITVQEYNENGVVYYVQDIYIRNIENLKCAFAENTYGKGIRESVLEMATSNNAIAAINGDYYGTSSDEGVVIRNGYLYRDNPTGDVLVLFYDGTMAVYTADAFDGDAVLETGAYQAWCFGPSLLDASGNACSSFFSSRIAKENPRTGIGYYEPGHYCFVTVDGRSTASAGMTLAEFSSLFASLDCRLAYNLDGGKTSVMTFGDTIVNIPDAGGRASSDIIYITE